MSEIEFRPPAADDGPRLKRFVQSVPEGEQRFFKEDFEDPDAVVAGWTANPRCSWLLAIEGEDMVGVTAALPLTGWSSHVAELRLIVAPSHRRRGLGRELARRALVSAIELGCTHVYIEVVAEQTQLVSMFQEMGFEPEALLRDFVRDTSGDPHDLLLLTHRVEDQWSRMEALGLSQAEI
jgi:ribosomal protein S18 acetylase RimI-like enzyme